jgi:hypothetical protein
MDITNPNWRCGYFVAAILMSGAYGAFAFRIHQWKNEDIPRWFWPRFHQHWFNFACAFGGWLAGWVVINRWLACPSFMCADEPKFATGVLALGAIIGMTGYLPLTIVKGIQALEKALSAVVGGK